MTHSPEVTQSRTISLKLTLCGENNVSCLLFLFAALCLTILAMQQLVQNEEQLSWSASHSWELICSGLDLCYLFQQGGRGLIYCWLWCC